MLKNKNIIIAVFIMVISFIFVDFLFNHLSYSATDSVGYHWFYIRKHFRKINKWDYVLFPAPIINIKEIKKEFKTFKTRTLVKQVACVPGDRLTEKHRMFYCNGLYLGTAKIRALDGEKINHFKFNGIIPKGYFFAFGNDVNSYDSRYYGLVLFKSIIAKAYPIPIFF